MPVRAGEYKQVAEAAYLIALRASDTLLVGACANGSGVLQRRLRCARPLVSRRWLLDCAAPAGDRATSPQKQERTRGLFNSAGIRWSRLAVATTAVSGCRAAPWQSQGCDDARPSPQVRIWGHATLEYAHSLEAGCGGVLCLATSTSGPI